MAPESAGMGAFGGICDAAFGWITVGLSSPGTALGV